MGAKISIEDLRRRATVFFNEVVDILERRNEVRGDSYLEMIPDDFVALWRDKAGRIKTAAPLTRTPAVLAEMQDSVRDIAGYAALFIIWMQEVSEDADCD